MDQWKGKVAIVSGASAGIGLAIVRDLVRHGVITVALSRRPELVNDLKPSLNESEGALLHSLYCDISDEASVMSTFEEIQQKFKAAHILINNAGILTTGTIMDGPFENLKKTLDVNVVGLLMLTKETFKLMKANGIDSGHVINVNSVAGHKIPTAGLRGGLVLFNIYPATKYAVTAMTETLRLEIASQKMKTKVTSLSPGVVKTDIFKANNVDNDGIVFTGPHLLPQHVSEAVIYVLSTPPAVNISELTIQPVGEPF